MKPILTYILLLFSTVLLAQKIDYNTKNGYVAEGFDVVSYFVANKPLKGKKRLETIYDGAKFKFSSQKNLALFNENPKKYIPQYGGYCAYAVAAKNTKMYIDAEAFEIRDDKLYLFYSSWFSSALTSWKRGDTHKLQTQGDKNWLVLKYKN